MTKDKVAVISTGNGGQSFAAWFAYKGANVSLYAREQERVDMFPSNIFSMSGVINADADVSLISCDMAEVVRGARLIMVTTPSNYHHVVAKAMAPYLENGQTVVLNPGRTFGTYEYLSVLRENGCRADVTLAEADTFIFTCRCESPGRPLIYCIKENVRIAAHDPARTDAVVSLLLEYFDSVAKAANVFETGFSNIGMIFHPVPILMNYTRVEKKEAFLYYHDAISPRTAEFLERLDAERVAVAHAAGIKILPVLEWLHDRYGSKGDTLYERIQNTDAYEGIFSPTNVNTRYVLEDVRTGCVPVSCVGAALGVPTPLIDSVITWASAVYGTDLRATGRNAESMDLPTLLSDLKKCI